MITDRLSDQGGAPHATSPAAVIAVNSQRLADWAAKQSTNLRRLFCEHGAYVGFRRSLAYLCILCPEE